MAKHTLENQVLVYQSDKDNLLSFHFHNGYEIIHVEEGLAEFSINGVITKHSKGHIIFINNLEQHSMRPLSSPYIRNVMIIDPDYFDKFVGDQVLCSLFKQRPDTFQNGFIMSDSCNEMVKEIFFRCVEEQTKQAPYWETAVMSLLSQMLIGLYREHGDCFPAAITDYCSENMSKIQLYIDKHFADELTLDGLAEAFHINKFHLAHVFKEVTGYTVMQYVLLTRVAHAKSLLFYTNQNIVEVATRSGFNSSSNFIRAFKGIEHITPLQYRKICMKL